MNANGQKGEEAVDGNAMTRPPGQCDLPPASMLFSQVHCSRSLADRFKELLESRHICHNISEYFTYYATINLLSSEESIKVKGRGEG